ncbi:MAG: hypothetical protein KF791_09530 [Verrucomicrobiae bacterium]|nr:hypothetical protein [Verrucomicrobiae bacterium]
MKTMKSPKPRKPGKRRGGPNPTAVPRKQLGDLTLGKMLSAAMAGRVDPAVLKIARHIATVREFEIKVTSLPEDQRRKVRVDAGLMDASIPNPIPQLLDGVAYAVKGTNDMDFAVRLCNFAVRNLIEFLARADGTSIAKLGELLISRPICPDPSNGGCQHVSNADEQAVRVAWTRMGATGIQPLDKSGRRLASKLFGMKKRPGRPRKNRAS